MNGNKPPLVVIAGPTASGKSALALRIAEQRGGTIINADATQVYADLPILSAMPSAAEQARVPHRLFGVLDGAIACTAARWAAMATSVIEAAWEEGRLPILVGGSGLYQRTLLDGMSPAPNVPADVRAGVRALALPDLRDALVREDPVMAARLHPNDPQRMARALEVFRSSGQSLARWQSANPEGGLRDRVQIDLQLVMPERATLEQAIRERIAAMWSAGALQEARVLAARNLPDTLPVMRAIGVPPLIRLFRGSLTESEAMERWFLDTRRYAKRQMTWYRNQGQ